MIAPVMTSALARATDLWWFTASVVHSDRPADDGRVFADDVAGTRPDPEQAGYRPSRVAVEPNGRPCASDDENGTIWRIVYAGAKEN